MSLRLYSAASGVLRDAHYVKNPVTGLYERTTLIEPAYTNLVTSEDLTAWTDVGTPGVTGSQSDPAGGTNAYLLEDDTAGVAEGKYRPVTFTADANKAFAIEMKAGTAAETAFGIYDATAAAWRHRVKVTWASGVPTISTGTGAGTLYGVWPLADGWYRIRVNATGVVAANANHFYIYPAGATASATGTVYVYRPEAYNAVVPPASTLAASGVKNADVAYLDFTAAPQEMTGYLRFFEIGGVRITNGTLKHIGSGTAGADARLVVKSNGTYYQAIHDNGTTESTSTQATAPTSGQLVELRWVVAPTGAIQLHQTINEGAEVSASAGAAAALASAFAGQRAYIGSEGGSNVGQAAFTHDYTWAGTKTLAECRSLAGVT